MLTKKNVVPATFIHTTYAGALLVEDFVFKEFSSPIHIMVFDVYISNEVMRNYIEVTH